jgi:malonyl-CoA/methylmalonyl-CoA synthetase
MRIVAGGQVHRASCESWQRHLGRRRPVSAPDLRQALGTGTIASVAERTLSAHGNRVVLDVDGRRATGNDLLAWSRSVAEALAAHGARPGDRVLLGMPTSLDFVSGYLGTLRAGCSAVLAGPASTRQELAQLLITGDPAWGVVSPAVAETLGGLCVPGCNRQVGSGTLLVRFAGASPKRTAPRGAGSSNPRQAEDEAVLAYTSGSTGEPKGVPLSHANLLASMRAAMAAWRWSPADVTVHCLPLHHQHGLGSIHALVLGGGRTVIKSRFDPGELAATVRSEHATVLLAVPAIYRRLLETAPGRAQFASLRLAVSGSAPLSPAVFEGIAETTGQIPVERYGLTESGLDVSSLCNGTRKAGSVGYPLPGVEAVVGDAELEHEAAPGTDGEILLRGPQVFSGYPGAGAGREEGFTKGGWLRTGDVGRIDPQDGSLSLTGRSKDVIISGGLNVYPREVELVLEQHPALAAVAVGGVSSERWGEAVCAFLVPRPGGRPQREELVALCRRSLAPHKHPKRFVLVAELPRSDMGKVLRPSLGSLADSGEPLH